MVLIRWWLVIEKSTLHLTKHQEASSSRLGRGGEISPNCLWHSCGGMPACHVHLYISIACLKTYSLLQCLATKQKKIPMHTPAHAAPLSMNERCSRYQSQKDAVAVKPLENPTTKSDQPWPAGLLCHRHLRLRRRGPEVWTWGRGFNDKPWLHIASNLYL